MSFEVPGFPRTFVLRHLDPSHDEIARLAGYRDWADYLRVVIREETSMTIFASPGTVPRGEKLTCIWTRAGEDVATINMHFAHRDGPDLVDFTEDDRTNIEGRFDTLWGAINAYYDETIALAEYRWHAWGTGIRKPNPATRDFLIASPVVGGNTDDMPLAQQVAISVTFRTTVRRNWGRVYLPAPVVTALDEGRIEEGHVTGIRNAFGTFADGVASDNVPLVVWSPRRLGGPLKYDKPGTGTVHHDAGDDNPDDTSFARTVDIIQVDDVPDVIRSRRVDKATVKLTHTLA